MKRVFWALALGSVTACASTTQQNSTFAIGAGDTHFATTGDVDMARHVEPPPVEGGPPPGDLRFKPEVCQGMDLHPESQYLGLSALTDFLGSQSIPFKLQRLRSNLVIVTIQTKSVSKLDLRVAILDSNEAAALELHRALLDHGQGSWGFHRGNLSVLGPIGDAEDVVHVMATTRLACWGTLLMAGRDDSFAIGGGYIEF